MKLWGGESDTGCCSVADVDDARRVAQQLGIDHHVFNFGDDFDAHVVEPYVAAHAAGRTPNPCIECNRHLKFDRLLRRADALGFDAVATGHHARIVDAADGALRARPRRRRRPRTSRYVLLHARPARRSPASLLPVGDLTKAEVRAEAAGLGLRTADKPDSQDVCFITSHRRAPALPRRPHRRCTPAAWSTPAGAEVGQVDAVELVTVGQRKGLGLAGAGEPPATSVDVDVARPHRHGRPADDLLVEGRTPWAGDGWTA